MTQAFNLSQLANGVDSSGKLDLSTNSKNPSWTTDIVANGLTVGKGAGSVATNTAVGASALAANTTGANSVAVGSEALKSQTTGGSNSVVGQAAMFTNTTGYYNAAMGNSAMYYNTTGYQNVALGVNALTNNTTASNNTAVGYQAAYSNTTGFANTFMGKAAGYTNTTGLALSAFGQDALYNNTTGGYNTALGVDALRSNTTSSNNTAAGYQAGYYSQGGGSVGSVFIGVAAGYGDATGYYNTYVGHLSGPNTVTNASGVQNTAVGRQALTSDTTGSYNTSVGVQSGYSCTTGYSNTFIGTGAGYSVTTGRANTFVGGGESGFAYSCGQNVTTGIRNSFFGAFSGSVITTGSSNSILGNYTGNQGGLDIRTASNVIVLSDGDGNPRLFLGDSGYVNCIGAYNNTSAAAANATFNASGYFSRSTSALKYKQDIRDLEEMDINLLRPVRYKSKCEGDDQTKDHFGLIADEAAEAGFDELVTRGVDGEVEGFQYERLTVVLLKKLQTLSAKVDAQAAEIAALKGQA
jgi:hypothetical protein